MRFTRSACRFLLWSDPGSPANVQEFYKNIGGSESNREPRDMFGGQNQASVLNQPDQKKAHWCQGATSRAFQNAYGQDGGSAKEISGIEECWKARNEVRPGDQLSFKTNLTAATAGGHIVTVAHILDLPTKKVGDEVVKYVAFVSGNAGNPGAPTWKPPGATAEETNGSIRIEEAIWAPPSQEKADGLIQVHAIRKLADLGDQIEAKKNPPPSEPA